jgi:hypothetical protein
MASGVIHSSRIQLRECNGFVVSVERAIRLAEFESLRLGLSESFPGSMGRDGAYRWVHTTVEERASAAKPAARFLTREKSEGVSPSLLASKPADLTVDAFRERLAG